MARLDLRLVRTDIKTDDQAFRRAPRTAAILRQPLKALLEHLCIMVVMNDKHPHHPPQVFLDPDVVFHVGEADMLADRT